MSDTKARQTTDSKQGGEGTTSFHNKSYDAMTKSIGSPPGNNEQPMPPVTDGTK